MEMHTQIWYQQQRNYKENWICTIAKDAFQYYYSHYFSESRRTFETVAVYSSVASVSTSRHELL
jgi:cobyrinic acid a,c-diamide synthase